LTRFLVAEIRGQQIAPPRRRVFRSLSRWLAAILMHDVHFPTSDGRMLIVSRYTELNADQKLLVKRLKLDLPSQVPAAHHRAGGAAGARCDRAGVVETFGR
jgi:hypothetical protein